MRLFKKIEERRVNAEDLRWCQQLLSKLRFDLRGKQLCTVPKVPFGFWVG
jgi:hypothetical protein